MDTILRLLEGLRRDEIAWLNTYLTGRLRAMPPPAAAAAAAAATAQVSAGPAHADIAGDSVDELPAVALAERVGDFNISMDPWEQTGAAPQGWAAHLHQTVIPVQGYIQLRPQDTTLPSFGSGPPATAATADENLPTDVAVREGGGKASPSVSIFSRAPLCSYTCRHCRCKPCDIATEHDDHICYNCEQYISQYKKDGSHPPCIDLAMALQGFDIDNTAAYHAIEDSKALHARRWQTKEGIYRIKRQALPDVRDAPLNDDNAAASSTDVKPRWRNWDEDYAKGYQRHP